jgi:hypothetical protein
MQRTDSDGFVFLVYWQCVAGNVTGQTPDGVNEYDYTAVEAGKLKCEGDPSEPGFIPYADLTENDVLDWVYDSLIEGDETAAEAKARVEANRTAKVQGQIDAAATTESGVPWAS